MSRPMSREDAILWEAAKNRLAAAHADAQRPGHDMLGMRMALSRLRQAANALASLAVEIEDRTHEAALKKLEQA